MRTTINLPDQLAAAAKRRAAEEGRTFTSLIEEALRSLLGAQDNEGETCPPLPTFGSPEGQILVEIEDHQAVWRALDGGAGAPR